MQYIIETVAKQPLKTNPPQYLSFGTDPQPSTKQEFDAIIEERLKVYPDHLRTKHKKDIWQALGTGKNITIGEKIIYCK